MVLKLIAVATLLLAGLVSYSAASIPQTGPKPIVVTPSPSTIDAGDGFTLLIQTDQVATSNTSVSLTSSNPSLVEVPSSVTLLAGYDTVLCPGSSSVGARKSSGKSTAVTVTATANGTSKATTIYVN